MSTSAITAELADTFARQRAIATFDHNLVVTAGAGAGNATLSDHRLVHRLLRDPLPLQITNMVALSQTTNAANEVKRRLRQRLHSYPPVKLDLEPSNDIESKTHLENGSLIDR